MFMVGKRRRLNKGPLREEVPVKPNGPGERDAARLEREREGGEGGRGEGNDLAFMSV